MMRIVITLLFFTITNAYSDGHTHKRSEDPKQLERYEKQSKGIKACVRTLNKGVYSYKTLQWKLDNCNAK